MMKDKHMQIRAEQNADMTAIDEVVTAAFLQAAHSSHTEQYIVHALREAQKLTVSLVALEAGKIVGHVAISPVCISDGSAHWYGLGPVAVLPAWQQQGIGKALIQAALEALWALDAAGCVVLGEPEYYQRFGFKAMPQLVLADVPPEYFMALAFQAELPHGEVTYHPAFNATA